MLVVYKKVAFDNKNDFKSYQQNNCQLKKKGKFTIRLKISNKI